jgi:hypothetical protein
MKPVLQAAALRLDGAELLDLVQRSGSVAPWLFLPNAIALATDRPSATRDCALRILKRCAAKSVRSLCRVLPLPPMCLPYCLLYNFCKVLHCYTNGFSRD